MACVRSASFWQYFSWPKLNLPSLVNLDALAHFPDRADLVNHALTSLANYLALDAQVNPALKTLT